MSGSQAPAARVPDRDTRARRAIRLAWISLGLLPISFGGAMIVGDWLLAVQGYQSGAEDIATTAALKAGLPAVLVLLTPTASAAWFALAAKKLGHPGWKAPMITAAVLAAVSIVLNLVQVLVALVFGP